jgi:hypothetical protein
MNKKTLYNRSGFIFIFIAVAVVIITVLVSVFYLIAISSYAMAKTRVDSEKAYYLSQGAIEYGLYLIENRVVLGDPTNEDNWPYSGTIIIDGEPAVLVSITAPDDKTYRITAQATISNRTRTVMAESTLSGDIILWE